MHDGSAAGFAVSYEAPDVEMETKGRRTILWLKAIPWARVIVDAFLVAGIVLASSNFLSVK
jgi:hypothetical protein